MLSEIELLMCNCSENSLKRTPTGPQQGVCFRRCPLKKGVHFREGVQEMRIKWRKIHKQSRVWKQKPIVNRGGSMVWRSLSDITFSDAKQLFVGCRDQLGKKDTVFDSKVLHSFKTTK